ncbi:MAG: hypothetical protein QG661_3276 [Actinomycetota bacterium]|nr:hypothetical protein [Actinomycetota bacterium]
MKKTIAAIVLLVALPLFAAADKVVSVWTAQATNTSASVETSGYQTAQVTFWAVSGSPDGTARVYSAAPNGAPLVLLATYATPSTAKTFRGPAGTGIVVTLTGMTTGTVGAVVVLK